MSETPAGWYPDPKMAGTQRYWDGSQWSDNIAPLTQQAQPQRVDFDGWKVLRWTALGVVAAVVAIYLVYAGVHSNDDLKCANRNAEHALNDEPLEDCGD